MPAWLRRTGWRAAKIAQWFRDNLEAELAERAGLNWLAVAFATGSLAYFSLAREPPLSVLAGATAAIAAVACAAYQYGSAWRILSVVAVLMAGATAAKL